LNYRKNLIKILYILYQNDDGESIIELPIS
jgi:hypothetical protein